MIYSLPYADYRENGEELFINIKPENDTCYYMAAKLWKYGPEMGTPVEKIILRTKIISGNRYKLWVGFEVHFYLF